MALDLELEWQEPGWRRMMESLPRGSVIPVERFFAMLGSVDEDEAREAALTLEARGVGLDVSRLPQCSGGAAAQRLARESELVRRGGIPGALDPGDPLRLYWQELEGLPRLDEASAQALAGQGAEPNRLTEGLLWLVPQEAVNFAGRGVLLLDLMQEGAMGLLRALEVPGEDLVESARWHVREAMARAVTLQYLASGEADRLLASLRAYQQADRRLLERLGRNPGPEELAQELGKPVSEIRALEKMVRDAAAAARRTPAPETAPEQVEDTAYFRLRARVEELLSSLEPVDREILKRRFGLEGAPAMGQEEAARALGLPLEELTRREAAAMRALRQTAPEA